MIETNRIEFKRELTKDLDIEKEVVAFLNYREGGILYIGIDDDGTPIGVADIDGDILRIKDRIRNGISPSPMGLFDVTVETVDEVPVIKVFVASGSETPYYKTRFGMSEKGCYIRVGTAAEPMSARMIEDLYAHRVRNSLRNIPSPRQNLSFRILRVYYEERSMTLNEHYAENLDFLLPDGRYNYVAFLMSDENNISVKLAKYSSTDRSQLISVSDYGCICLLQTADRIIERLKIENTITSQKTYKARIDSSLWNEKAIREVVMNALIHNDYTDEVPPKFEIFADHLEITSSGGLPIGLTQDEFFSGVSKPRNKELMRIFCDVDFGESLGSGMASVMKTYSPANFTFFPHFVRFSVEYINHAILSMESKTSESGRINAETGRINAETGRINAETGRINAENGPLNAKSGPLNAKSGPLNAESGPLNAKSGPLNETESLLLELINRHKGVNRTSLIALAHISERTANRWLSSLTQKHLIERRGSKKTGGYWLVDSSHIEK